MRGSCIHLLPFFSGGAAAQKASKGAQEGAKRAASNSVMGLSLEVLQLCHFNSQVNLTRPNISNHILHTFLDLCVL